MILAVGAQRSVALAQDVQLVDTLKKLRMLCSRSSSFDCSFSFLTLLMNVGSIKEGMANLGKRSPSVV